MSTGNPTRTPVRRYAKGRVTLLGDAAHCMYPSLGLGISCAFQDAAELARCLLGDEGSRTTQTDGVEGGIVDFTDVSARLEMYARRRMPVTWAMQAGSRLMHLIFAAMAERPDKQARGDVDPTGAFFKAWKGGGSCGFWAKGRVLRMARVARRVARARWEIGRATVSAVPSSGEDRHVPFVVKIYV